MNVELASDLTSDPLGWAHPPWTRAEAQAVYDLPFNDLLFRAQTIHRENFDPNRVQLSRLLSIKTGGCPED
ncbi:MAG: biotin synthase BioB, partial [Mesorhizobium sp.]